MSSALVSNVRKTAGDRHAEGSSRSTHKDKRTDDMNSPTSSKPAAMRHHSTCVTNEYEDMLSKVKEQESERDVLMNEEAWIQKIRAVRSLSTLEGILRDCCRRLNITNKLHPSIKLNSQQPCTEKLQLVQRNGGDALKVAVSLLGDTIIITEVTMKYPKAPGGVFRSVSQPDVQWKLQQLQDTANYCVQALTTTVKGMEFVKKLYADKNNWTLESGKALTSIVTMVTNLIGQARSSLCIPHKRTLLELCNFPSTRCFNPPLPNDLVFSYYIASTRIVCAAYLMTSKPNGLTITQADYELPQLVDVLSMLTRALNVAQELRYALSMFDSQIKNTIDEDGLDSIQYRF